jgi:hypothetical protein
MRPIFGVLAVIALAFGSGALAYREAESLFVRPVRGAARPAAAVAGQQSPPAWVGEFARAFCSGDAGYVSAHVAGQLDIGEVRISDAFAHRAWQCLSSRYLGTASNTDGDHHVFVLQGNDQQEQWYVFTVLEDKVVGLE